MKMEFMSAVLKRRTYRDHFVDKPISQDDLKAIIESARWAPSPFNIQPWEILIVTQQESKNALAELVLKSMSAQMGDARFLHDVSQWMSLTKDEWEKRGEGVMIDDHVEVPDIVKDRTMLKPLLKNAKNMSFLGKLGLGKIGASKFVELIRKAPLIMIILMNKQKKSPGENRATWELLGMGAFIEHVLLSATSLNIGTHFINAPLETKKDRDSLRAIFSVPEHYEPLCMVRAGYYTEPPKSSVRLNPKKFVHYEQFGCKSD
jgi:nitroreductase